MQITKPANNSPNFQAKYILSGDDKLLKRLQTEFIPLSFIIKPHLPIGALSHKTLFDNYLNSGIERCAKSTQYSKEWLIQNASNHGINVDLSAKDEIYIFTGNDYKKCIDFLKKKTNFKEKIVRCFTILRSYFSTKEIPNHLRSLKLLNEQVKAAELDFYNFMGKDVKHLNNIYELIHAISKEH